MAKTKTAFFCQNCGYNAPKWIGKCPSCGEWNTFVEEVLEKENKSTISTAWKEKEDKKQNKALPLKEIEINKEKRIDTLDSELNRVLGGGIVPGSLILVGGEPGIGKSTLLLQVAIELRNLKILYVSGEESAGQIKMRAERINPGNESVLVLTETSTHNIFQQIKTTKPGLLIIDSIQTLHSEMIDAPAGSVSQIRQTAAELQRFAKASNVAVFLIGHITKEGSLAGPKVLEHIVDTVLVFEGDRNYTYRILRTTKNRFGSTSELGIYEMQGNGLRQVKNPSEILITQRDEDFSGIAIAATLEGLRPMLIETQALVTPAVYGTPQRTATGFDLRRLSMLLAVLEKRCGFQFGMKDVFLNLAGGLKIEDPAIDLAIVCALLSSFEDISIPQNYCFAGEVGLSGEIRAVNRIENRIAEADKLGFEKIFISKHNKKSIDLSRYKMEIVFVSKIEEVYRKVF